MEYTLPQCRTVYNFTFSNSPYTFMLSLSLCARSYESFDAIKIIIVCITYRPEFYARISD